MPLRDWTLVHLADGSSLGIVYPDVYALDADEHRVRLPLLRSPVLAWDEAEPGTSPRRVFSDRGAHKFRFRFFLGPDVTSALRDQHACTMQRPLVIADLTRGMPERGERSG